MPGTCKGCATEYERSHCAQRYCTVQCRRRARYQRLGPAAQVEKTERWKARWPEKARLLKRRMTLKQYGITLDEYASIVAAQGGGCGICGREKNLRGMNLGVDHDHVTGIVRGVLCETCNRAIGLLGDSPEMLERALVYLRAGYGERIAALAMDLVR